MNLYQRFVTSLIVMGIMFSVITGCAHRPPTPEERLQAFVQDMIHKLRLDASQEEKLELLSKAVRKAMKKAKSDGGPFLDKLMSALSDARWDESLLTLLRDLKELLTDEVGPEIVKRLADFYLSLSATQRDKFSDWLENLSN